ncbi:hypothetical protein CAOG_06450 [Capsaspora owczarzaki ATCC 30864]|uniref:Chromatin modification-related protein MEAF6 n=1 Tax=Capsaspora owczarzaki (strain ATCC 30864) TaxID=595528 RepID=A0A0D2WVB6_CAPO3|nr:hypothetical protein CAOG_06450 [Capsaspora owczarzaki ATCC 30864]KJE96078.1 hypothetical protein CAOG_006450 [Capsaspora owczarzaki ATCC 30864]|eukprot:XP_004345199.1 hypothetical protein CAOG_06450 [Capsaspora owczarzaki ATCC 30864]
MSASGSAASASGAAASGGTIAANARAELEELLARKTQIDKSLQLLEQQIYAFEGSYLEDTQLYGNIIRGWDGYLSNRATNANDRQKRRFKDTDRLFSLSSCTSPMAAIMAEQSTQEDDDRLAKRRPKN